MKKTLSIIMIMTILLGMMTSVMSFGEEINVAKIGDTEYATLAEAVAAANSDTQTEGAIEIELIADTTFESAITVKRDITLSGAYTIKRGSAYAGTLFTVNKGATLTLDGDLTIDGNNNWSFDSEGYYADMKAYLTLSTGAKKSYTTSNGVKATSSMISIANGGAVVMNKATIQNTYSDNHINGSLFKVPTGATLTTNEGSIIKHIHNSVAGQVGGTWTMNGGEINDVFAHNTNGGVLDIRGGVFNLNGGNITGVRTLGLNSNGNGIIVQVFGNSSKMNMAGGHIYGNASFSPGNGWGSIIYLNRGGDFTMTGGIIEETSTDISSAFVSNDYTQVELLGGTIVVDDDTHPTRFESLFAGNTVIGENMNIVGKKGAHFIVLGNKDNTLEINGKVSGEGNMWLMHTEPVTGTGLITSNVLIKTHSYMKNPAIKLASGEWKCLITVDSIESGASLKVMQDAYLHDGLVRVLGSVASGDYTNADESAKEQADSYMEDEGAKVESPVLFYHRLTAAQKKNITVTFDYNGGLDAQGWSGVQMTTENAAFTEMTLPTPALEGYALIGWKYAVENDPESLSMEGATWFEGEEITENVRLVAQWGKIACDVVIEGTKYLDEELAGGFEFEIKKDSETLETVKSDENGKFTFTELVFEEEGTYVFEVSEVIGTDEEVEYDDTTYTVTITVVCGVDGKLTATVEGEEEIVFNNKSVVNIPEDPTPLDPPNTGDGTGFFTLLAIVALALGFAVIGKKRLA